MRFNAFKQIWALYYFKRSQFSHFAAQGGNAQSYMLRAFYALGMYKSATETTGNHFDSVKALLAKVASYAACGQHAQVKLLSQKIEQDFPSEIEELIAVLTPFDSLTALQLVKKHKICSFRAVALLIRHQELAEAETLLGQCALVSEQDHMNFYLLKIQLDQDRTQHLNYLNQIYQHYNLNEIRKINEDQLLRVSNLYAEPLSTHAKSPLLSILITSYNSENYIAATLDSLLCQTLSNIELIIVDDVSTDNTWDIISAYAAKDARIKPYRQTANAGTYTAKNRALSLAKGEFVVCHDADDWSHPQRLELQLQPLLENKRLIATISNWFRLSDSGEVYSRSIYPIIRLNPSSLLFRRKPVMSKLGFWDTVRTGADSEFLRRVKLQFGNKAIHKINLPLAIGAHHANSLMNAPETGFVDQKMPTSRLEYWEAWNKWHIDVIKGKSSFYLNPFLLEHERKFAAPQQLLVDDQALLHYRKSGK